MTEDKRPRTSRCLLWGFFLLLMLGVEVCAALGAQPLAQQHILIVPNLATRLVTWLVLFFMLLALDR